LTIPSYTPQTWVNGVAGGTPINAGRLLHMEAGITQAGRALLPTAIKSSYYVAADLDLVLCNTYTTGAFTVQLPTTPPYGTMIAVKLILQTGSNAVTVLCGGADVINKVGGSNSITLGILNQLVLLQYFSGVWYVENDSLPLAGLDARYQTLTDVAVTTSASGALVVGQHNPVDATGGVRVMTLANASKSGLWVSLEKFDSSVNAVSITGLIRGVGGTTITLVRQSETRLLVSKADGSWWPVASNKSTSSLLYTDLGIVTSSAADIATTPLRTITDPFGTGIGYRVACGFFNGNVSSSIGAVAQVSIRVNGANSRVGKITAASSSVFVRSITDFPAGGTSTFQGWLINKSDTFATYADGTAHAMTTEVSML
jgi:hypothetical protein